MKGRWLPRRPPGSSLPRGPRSRRAPRHEGARALPTAHIAWVPLTRASPSLASSTTGSRRARASAARPGSRSLPTNGLALADEDQGEVRERSKVPRGAHAASLGDDRDDAAVEHVQRELEGARADARVALREDVAAQQQQRAGLGMGSGVPTPAAWERRRLRWRVRRSFRSMRTSASVAEAGVDAVGRGLAGGDPIHERARPLHSRQGLRRELDVDSAARHVADLLQAQRLAVQEQSTVRHGRRKVPRGALSTSKVRTHSRGDGVSRQVRGTPAARRAAWRSGRRWHCGSRNTGARRWRTRSASGRSHGGVSRRGRRVTTWWWWSRRCPGRPTAC
jgi:hypothetical protein